MLPVFVGLALLTAGNLWWAFFRKPAPASPIVKTAVLPVQKVEINWDILTSENLQDLQPFPVFPTSESSLKVGRENPFLPVK